MSHADHELGRLEGVLVLANPGHGLDKMQASAAIDLGMQLLLPGEWAPSHRQTPNAKRQTPIAKRQTPCAWWSKARAPGPRSTARSDR